MILDLLILTAWISPIIYTGTTIAGKIANKIKKHTLGKRTPTNLLIYQVPTIGNYETTNQLFKAIKSYKLPVRLETWVIVEEEDLNIAKYVADKIIIVPKNFECEDLYKSRALEYARRLRGELLLQGRLPENYLVLHGDDDSLPSKAFINDCLLVNADLIVGSMSPRPKGFWGTMLEYERSVACSVFCNFFTNIGYPVFGHGEGMCVKASLDQGVSYDVKDVSGHDLKLISSEDLFYIHKSSIKGYKLFNSEKPVYIIPPLTLRDAVKQRRRWIWGHIRIATEGLLPLNNCARLILVEFSGLIIYFTATLGIPLHYLGFITIPPGMLSFTWLTLFMWLGFRAYAIGHLMGKKQAILGALCSYGSVTLNFLTHLIGILKGDPKTFEVIKKQID